MSWIHGIALAGLAATAIPIAIHLMRNRQTTLLELGTLRFLEEALLETKSRRRLRDLLLLLLRILAVGLLAFLFARPLLEGNAVPPAEAAVLLIDASTSMAGTGLGKTNWELARETAAKVLREDAAGATVQMAVYSDVVVPIGDLDDLPADCRGEANHEAALRWARERISELPGEGRRIFWITDLQTLPGDGIGDGATGAPVELLNLALPGDWNAAITAVDLLTPTVGESATLAAQVSALGAVPDEANLQLVVELSNGNSVRAPVPANGRVEVEIPAHKLPPAWLRGEVRLTSKEADAWRNDNRRDFAFPIANQTPVLVVDGAPGKSRFENGSYYLTHALSLSADNGGLPRYGVTRVELAPPEKLDDYQIVILCDVDELSSLHRDKLLQFVAAGGRLLYFVGGRCEPQTYNRWAEAGLFPAKLTPRELSIPRSVSDWQRLHPALRLFDGGVHGDLSKIIIQDHFAVEPLPEVEALASLRDGTPCLLSKSHGKGRIVAFTNPADRSWTPFAVSRLYVPFVHELMAWLADRGELEPPPLRTTSLGRPEQPGVVGDPPTAVIVNPDSESRPEALSPEAFRAQYGLTAPRKTQADADQELPEDRQRDTEIWAWFAVTLLTVTVGENLLAHRMRS